ncbi:hypothetical protein P7M17_18015 [Vibrio parahaemolyticus]|nr:hypothetical protein [Vibrio parahaemolyticus]
MKKIVSVKPLVKRVSFVIHLKRLASCGDDNCMIDKEFDRYDSMTADLAIEEKAGDPGRLKVNHGCEARGI